ncbi:MAG TPA: serine/threonine-protein kinase [Gemmatimonadales bacterium]|nr:serine/threonine-protein kinase [Gemmatimonadales bacterium]
MNTSIVDNGVETEARELAEFQGQVVVLTGDRYEVERVIARGGMSVVLLAFDRLEGKQVALKLLDPRQGASIENRERFRREAMISARLAHPHIVPCHDFHHRGNLAMAVMRYIPGHSLGDLLPEGRRLPVDEVLRIVIAIADALAHTHAEGIVHRDVKPANILLHDDGSWPFLTDFGIATLRTSEHSRSEVYKGFGTPAFMSPEQALGRWDADFRTDVYSLGLVAYRALAGRLPFTAESAVALAAQRTIKNAPPIRSFAPEVPPILAAIIDRCLARDPRKRWRSAATLRDALKRFRANPNGLSWLAGLFGKAPVASSLLGQAASWGAIGLWLRR